MQSITMLWCAGVRRMELRELLDPRVVVCRPKYANMRAGRVVGDRSSELTVPNRIAGQGPDQSALMFAALITFAAFAISDLFCAAISCGVFPPTITPPSVSS